jgi:hypothetical protein
MGQIVRLRRRPVRARIGHRLLLAACASRSAKAASAVLIEVCHNVQPGFAPVYMNKLAAKMRTMVARTAHENDHFSARQARLTATPYAAVVAAFGKPNSSRRRLRGGTVQPARACVRRRPLASAVLVVPVVWLCRAGQHRHGPSFGRLDWVRVRACVGGCEGWNGAGRPRVARRCSR